MKFKHYFIIAYCGEDRITWRWKTMDITAKAKMWREMYDDLKIIPLGD